MRLIASSNNGDTVSTNCFLFSPVNSDQIPVLGKENASRNSHWLSRFAGLQDCNFAFTWQGCSCIAVTYRTQMPTTRHRFPVNTRLFFHIFTFFSSSCFIFPSVFSIPKQHLASWHRPDAAQNSSKPHTHLWLFSFHQKWTMVLKPTSTNELSKSRCHLYGTVCFFLYKEALAHSSAPQFLERCNEMRTPHNVHQLNYSSSILFLTLPRKVLSSLS